MLGIDHSILSIDRSIMWIDNFKMNALKWVHGIYKRSDHAHRHGGSMGAYRTSTLVQNEDVLSPREREGRRQGGRREGGGRCRGEGER